MEIEKFGNSITFRGRRIVNFNVAMQVKFYDAVCECWRSGIGYNDVIICACCGGAIPIREIYEDAATLAEDNTEPIVPLKAWVDFSDYIL